MTQTTQTETIEAAEIPGGLALPTNAATGRPYQGKNIARLLDAAADAGYSSPIWGGYGQLQDAGWQVRRGETSTEILAVFGTSAPAGKPAGDTPTDAPPVVEDRGDGPEERRRGRGVRVLRVFNVEQCDRMTPEQVAEARERREARKARAAERRAKGGKRKARKGSKKK